MTKPKKPYRIDFFSLRGSIKTKGKISSEKIRIEFERYLAKRHLTG